jgi:GTPase SAR1 family protein
MSRSNANIKQNIDHLTINEMKLFAWRCAMYSLPFLGRGKDFSFFKENQKTHLYTIFHILDSCLYYSGDRSFVYGAEQSSFDDDQSDIKKVAADAFSVGNVGKCAGEVILSIYNAHAIYEMYQFKYMDGENLKEHSAYTWKGEHTYEAYLGAISAYRNYFRSNTNPEKSLNVLVSLIENDLEIIRNKQQFLASRNLIRYYNKIWDNFQEALEKVGLSYWAQTYKRLFEKNFVLDEIEKLSLEQRMHIPTDISKMGIIHSTIYLENKEKHEEVLLNESRIIILGEKGAGKTTLARKLVDSSKTPPDETESTPGVETSLWSLDRCNVHIWDFAGHAIDHAVHKFFLARDCFNILVYDGRTEHRNRIDYWLEYIKIYGANSKTIVLVNMRDKNKPNISLDKYVEININVHPRPIFFSIKDDKPMLEKFKTMIAKYIQDNPTLNSKKIDKQVFQIKNKIEKIFSSLYLGKPYIFF